MGIRGRRYPSEVFARRGQEIYDKVIRPKLQPEDHGKFVAIDIETECYEIDANDYAATSRLIERIPDSQIWLMRVGHATACKFGFHLKGMQ